MYVTRNIFCGVSTRGLCQCSCIGSTAREHLDVTGSTYEAVHRTRIHACGRRTSLSLLQYNYLMKSYQRTVRVRLSAMPARAHLVCLFICPLTPDFCSLPISASSQLRKGVLVCSFVASFFASKLSSMLTIDKCSLSKNFGKH